MYVVIKTDFSSWLVLIKSWHFNTWQPWWNRTLRSNTYSDNRPLAPVCKHLKNTWTFNWAWEWYGSPQNVVNTKMQLFISSAANSFKLFIWKKKCIHHYIFYHRDEIEKRNAFGRVGGVHYSQNWSGIVARFAKHSANWLWMNLFLMWCWCCFCRKCKIAYV